MECPYCCGDGYFDDFDSNGVLIHPVCNYCNGTGQIVPTHEEIFRYASIEELACFLCNNLMQEENGTLQNRFFKALYSQYPVEPMNAYHEVIRWLKEKHEEAK